MKTHPADVYFVAGEPTPFKGRQDERPGLGDLVLLGG
jgi:hypothetical protein